jgi:UDP-N-acetylglucosamine acyltransferase
MATLVNPLAAVDPEAQLDDGVSIGPFCVVGPHARLGRGTVLINSVTVMGDVTIGCDNIIYPGCVLGGDPQDTSFSGGRTRVVIGDRNTIRENTTIHGGRTRTGGTIVGSDCFLMAGVHVAHDCHVGNHVLLAGGALLGGHVIVGPHAALSGAVCVHPWCTIGEHSFVEGNTRVLQDVPPFTLFDGQPARPRCINAVGLTRAAFSDDQINALVEAHRLLFRAKLSLAEARAAIEQAGRPTPEVTRLLDFVSQQHQGMHGRSRERTKRAA